jgi:hypothetical protein
VIPFLGFNLFLSSCAFVGQEDQSLKPNTSIDSETASIAILNDLGKQVAKGWLQL